MPCCFLSPLDMRASRKHHCAIVAYDVQIFWPDTHQPLPSRRAAVCSDAKSEPAFGSLKPWHQIASPRAIGGRCVRRCSSVPCRMMAGPTQLTPMYCAPRGSWCAHISSRTAVCSHGEAPRPPNSSGHAMHSSTRSARSRQNVCATTPATVSSAEITRDRRCLELVGQRREAIRAAGDQRDLGAGAGAGDSRAEPRRRAGDDRDPAREIEHRPIVPSRRATANGGHRRGVLAGACAIGSVASDVHQVM
jgi:hypothetical protein